MADVGNRDPDGALVDSLPVLCAREAAAERSCENQLPHKSALNKLTVCLSVCLYRGQMVAAVIGCFKREKQWG